MIYGLLFDVRGKEVKNFCKKNVTYLLKKKKKTKRLCFRCSLDLTGEQERVDCTGKDKRR